MNASSHSGHRGENYERLVRQERLILDVTEQLTEALLDAGATQAELARRLDRTPSFVSQVLAGGRNLTLRTIADVAAALGLRPSLKLSSGRKSVVGSVRWTYDSGCLTLPIAKSAAQSHELTLHSLAAADLAAAA